MSHMAQIRAYTDISRAELESAMSKTAKKLGFKKISQFYSCLDKPLYLDIKYGFKEVYSYKGKPVLEGKAICYNGNILYSARILV